MACALRWARAYAIRPYVWRDLPLTIKRVAGGAKYESCFVFFLKTQKLSKSFRRFSDAEDEEARRKRIKRSRVTDLGQLIRQRRIRLWRTAYSLQLTDRTSGDAAKDPHLGAIKMDRVWMELNENSS